MSLCAIGDTLSSRETETMFMVGNGAFAAGNLTYVALFLVPNQRSGPDPDPARNLRELHAKVRKWRSELGKCRTGSGYE